MQKKKYMQKHSRTCKKNSDGFYIPPEVFSSYSSSFILHHHHHLAFGTVYVPWLNI